MDQDGLLAQITPLVWHTHWNGHRQATPNGHTSFTSRAPSVFKVAISHRRIVALTDRTVTFTSRKVGSARLRTTTLDAMELLRRFLQHLWPEGVMTVRHFGLLHASCAIPTDTLRLLIVPAHPIDFKPTQSVPPAPLAARCPTCGAPMHVVMRLWTAHRACVDTGGEAGLCPDDRGATRCVHPTAPVRPPPTLWRHKAAQNGSATGSQRPADPSRGSADAPIAMPHHGVRRTIPTCAGRHTLADTFADMPGFLEHRIAVTTAGHLNPY